jgi:Resolvase, N terminal domain/Helix-turn-helix domain of resolvase
MGNRHYPTSVGLAAVLDYARPGDTIVVVGIDRLGRNAAEVMTTIRDLGERGIVLRSLREGIDTSNATGRMVAGVLASLAELELELQRERVAASKAARKSRGQSIGRPKALTAEQIALAERMRASGEPVPVIAQTLKVSRATLYRTLAEKGCPTPDRRCRASALAREYGVSRATVYNVRAAALRQRRRDPPSKRRRVVLQQDQSCCAATAFISHSLSTGVGRRSGDVANDRTM